MAEIVMLRGAESDLLETYARYELTKEGLGERFSQNVEEAPR